MKENKKIMIVAAISILSIMIPMSACGSVNNDDDIPVNSKVETIDTPSTPDSVVNVTESDAENVISIINDVASNKINIVSNVNTSSKENTNNSSKATSSKDNTSSAVSSTTSSNVSKVETTSKVENTPVVSKVEEYTYTVEEPVYSEVEVPVVEPEPEPVIIPEPEPEPVIIPEPEPEPEPEPVNDPYVYPYDIDVIRQDMIDYGISLGMRYSEIPNLENSSWGVPMSTDDGSSGEWLKNYCFGQLDWVLELCKCMDSECVPSDIQFNVIYIRLDNGEYDIYVPCC